MIILSKKQKTETNVHLNIKVINKGPGEDVQVLSRTNLVQRSFFGPFSDSRTPPPPFPGSF